jgi:gamma-glutamyltranspeptidase/glutathione hydrolase
MRIRCDVKVTLLVAIWFSFCQTFSLAADWPGEGTTAQSSRGMVVSVSRPASEVGRQILQQGGNAVDAAVAVGFALAVTWPEAGNIGGGGFMVIHPGQGRPPVVIDYREQAPAAATVDMFARGAGTQYRLVGVPGTVRGLKRAHERFGRLSWESLVLPAADLARDGFVVSAKLAESLNQGLRTHRANGDFVRTYSPGGDQPAWQAGGQLVQSDLSRTLRLIAAGGADAFYNGPLADLLEAEMQRGGGLITRGDLAAYQARERGAIHGTFRGYDVYAPPPPSSGGTVLIEMLNLAERFDLRSRDRWSARTLHIMVECMRRAYCDRAKFLGDPDFTDIPPHLTSKAYAEQQAQGISLTAATSSAVLGADILVPGEGSQTTHFSVIDQDGIAVSNTFTLEQSFGSGIVVRGAGYLLNNEMGDFNPQPGVTNAQGLIGTKANLVAPGKRMLSSMCPVVVARDGRVVLVTGSPGGRTIINTLFCVVLNVLEFEMPLRDAVDAPRLHHGWMPDRVRMEEGLLQGHKDEVGQLRDLGHSVDTQPARQGDAHSIYVDGASGRRIGAVDSRHGGWAAGN